MPKVLKIYFIWYFAYPAAYKPHKFYRTEYWKSQTRKYCEFCKCWFADNKVSISFHENGKRHKENVQKHISQLSKKSAKEFKQQEKIDDTMKKMEAAAMAAYLKDVQNNGDLTSQSIIELVAEHSSTESKATIVVGNSKSKSAPVWQEVKGEDGSSYYWNTITNETTWDTPDEYLSLADQEKKSLKQSEVEKKKHKQKDEINKKRQEEAVMELKAHLAREKLREFAVKEPTPVRTPVDYGPAPIAKPYGTWKPVVNETSQNVDLQLPTVVERPPPPVIMEPEVFKFKEKRVESLGEGPVEFKKRKLNNHKRNMRQKVDDD